MERLLALGFEQYIAGSCVSCGAASGVVVYVDDLFSGEKGKM